MVGHRLVLLKMEKQTCVLVSILGGTKIEGAILGTNGNILVRHRMATPQGDYSGTLAVITKLVTILDRPPPPVGTSIPGAVSPATGQIKNAAYYVSRDSFDN